MSEQIIKAGLLGSDELGRRVTLSGSDELPDAWQVSGVLTKIVHENGPESAGARPVVLEVTLGIGRVSVDVPRDTKVTVLPRPR